MKPGNLSPPEFVAPPERVVSLIPSMTESMFTLGLGERLVGITEYCVRPEMQTSLLPKIGGTKNASADAVLALKPDLVIANQEENAAATVAAIEKAGVPVWLTFPRTVKDAVDTLYGLAGIFRAQQAVMAVKSLATAVDYAVAAMPTEKIRYFCPIWFDQLADGTSWWMTFNWDTYSNDLLGLLGGENIFKDRERHFPLEADIGVGAAFEPSDRDTRYPRIGSEELRRAAPDLVILPSEPFAFSEQHIEPLQAVVGEGVRFAFVDGSLLTWHGTRLAQALQLDLKNI